jgi:hypothetical protein
MAQTILDVLAGVMAAQLKARDSAIGTKADQTALDAATSLITAMNAAKADKTALSEVETRLLQKVADLIGGAPEQLDTLKEISDFLKVETDKAAALTATVATKAAKADLDALRTEIGSAADFQAAFDRAMAA